jgi:pimeloyl-ACP methyl ester carboxylesterase
MTTFVLVPGACHGGWWYAPLVEALAAAGHAGHAVTLTGLDPRGPQPPAEVITLERHVDDVAKAVLDAPGDGVVLVGHSYGGTVVTAVADRVPERVAALVYLDAFVPDDGDSCWAMTTDEQRRWYVEGAGRTGLGVDPLPFFDARARPHPLATLVQRVSLTGAWRSVPVKHYVAAARWAEPSPFAPTTARLQGDPAWTVHVWDTRHNVLWDGPGRVLDLLTGIGRA